MSELAKTLPYELLTEHLAKEAIERFDDTINELSPRFREFLHEVIHDTLETGMGLAANEGTPGDVMNAYNAGFAAGQQETQGE